MQDILGFGLAAGKGVRLQPLTLKASGYIRSKAAVRFLGERIVTWILRSLHAQGVDDITMITRGKENRGQVKSAIQYGEHLGMQIRYSPVELDAEDTGSGGAVLENLVHQQLVNGTLFVFPTDSLLEFDLPAMAEHHQRTHADVTIACAEYPADVIADRYGLLETDSTGRVWRFLEKPSLETISSFVNGIHRPDQAQPLFLTNAGFYLMDVRAMREISRHPAIARRAKPLLDIGGDLLPWMVSAGYSVQTFPVNRMGDLGNIPSYVQTMTEVLTGKFPTYSHHFHTSAGSTVGSYIDPTSMEMTDPISGLSLRDKIIRGMVQLEHPVRIGKYVCIDPGVTVTMSNIDDECHLQVGATLVRSSVGEGSVIGPYSRLTDAVTGMMVNLLSTRPQPISLSDYAALGDEVVLHPGVALSDGATVAPRMTIPAGIQGVAAAGGYTMESTPSSHPADERRRDSLAANPWSSQAKQEWVSRGGIPLVLQ